MTDFLSESKGKRDLSHKSNKGTWHGLCSQRVARVGHPESGNSKKPYCITTGLLYYYLLQEKYLIVEGFNAIPFCSLALALSKRDRRSFQNSKL